MAKSQMSGFLILLTFTPLPSIDPTVITTGAGSDKKELDPFPVLEETRGMVQRRALVHALPVLLAGVLAGIWIDRLLLHSWPRPAPPPTGPSAPSPGATDGRLLADVGLALDSRAAGAP